MKPFHLRSLAFVAVSFLLLGAGCKKAPAPETVVVTTPAPAATPTPTPAASPAAAPAAAPVSTAAPDGLTITATVGDSKAVEWALKQDEIKKDPLGQWASGATASSSYNDAKDKEGYAPWQATGVPNVDQESDNPAAWTSKTADAGIEWLDLTFPKAVAATGLRIRENEGAGSIIKIELFDESGTSHTLWTGTDPTRNLNYFILTFPKTSYKTNRVKITLATNLIPGWNEIDAVQLLGS